MTTSDKPRRRMAHGVARQLGEGRGLPLSVRELEILGAVMAGHVTGADLARVLHSSYSVTRYHLCGIYIKLDAANLADVILMVTGRKACPVDLSEYVF